MTGNILVLRQGGKGRAVPCFRTFKLQLETFWCFVWVAEAMRYLSSGHAVNPSMGAGAQGILQCRAKLKQAAPAHPCARGIPFILNITPSAMCENMGQWFLIDELPFG